ncbi:transposase [Burkholderia pseudomallei]|uniref:transposase n=1 Tax=Burkholderia pseudomallei TaxID=28450 RepID=UPI00035B9E64|nr:putative transposition transposase [Burkholderia pseudomallei MSHR305]AHK69587.1 putative tn501 transposition transposase [Burkholderia pseudomallei MSHR520]AIP82262.1 putative transposition transposase [Burkholderia pseudomallei]KGW58428.1 putative transposition transposase [Burkholderia pseudomallei MSHR303]
MLTQQAYDLMPRVKITDLLFEVDQWTNFTPHFTHLKSDAEPPDRTLLLTGDLCVACQQTRCQGAIPALAPQKIGGAALVYEKIRFLRAPQNACARARTEATALEFKGQVIYCSAPPWLLNGLSSHDAAVLRNVASDEMPVEDVGTSDRSSTSGIDIESA